MPPVNWTVFEGLPGAATDNFEHLCRALIRRHYNQFGSFQGLSNQPGIEFHLNISTECALGEAGRWYGWQCKWYDLPSGRAIGKIRRQTIEDAIKKTEEILPDITDWVLWTRHTLTKGDQKWFYAIKTKMKLHLWTKDEVEEHLSGPAEILRGTYFGELVLTPDALKAMQRSAVAPIRQRWIPEVHQVMRAEEQIRLSLGSVEDWSQLLKIPQQLNKSIQCVIDLSSTIPENISDGIEGRRLPIVIDGLNEAEDPRLWKPYLESFAITLSNSPYVLLVCTLRSEFAKETLPDSVQQFDIPGFTGHTMEAIKAYFKYYLIEKGDAELPMHLLNHPLTMRLFCEVTNPERKKLVGVEAMPGSLAALPTRAIIRFISRCTIEGLDKSVFLSRAMGR